MSNQISQTQWQSPQKKNLKSLFFKIIPVILVKSLFFFSFLFLKQKTVSSPTQIKEYDERKKKVEYLVNFLHLSLLHKKAIKK